MIAGIAQCGGRLLLADNANERPPLSQLSTQVGKVGIAGDETERINDLIEKHFHGVRRKRDIGRILATRILILKARSKCLPDQCILPTRCT